jgi:hypothetical protein
MLSIKLVLQADTGGAATLVSVYHEAKFTGCLFDRNKATTAVALQVAAGGAVFARGPTQILGYVYTAQV